MVRNIALPTLPHRHAHAFGLALCLYLLPTAAAAHGQLRTTTFAPLVADALVTASAVDFDADEPPPSTYDRLGKDGSPALAPESMGLMRQLGRTLLGTAATLALLYLFFKLMLPRLMQRVGPNRARTLEVTERVALDGKNSLVAVQHLDGRRWLLGCGEGGVVLVAQDAAPEGGPGTLAQRSPAKASFAEVLQPTLRSPDAT